MASGALLVDLLAPVADFGAPDEGAEVVVAPGPFEVRWEERERPNGGAITRRLDRERVRVANGSCPDQGWLPQGRAVRDRSPVLSPPLVSGWCYRWRLNLADARDNFAAELSGTVRVEAP